MNKSIAIKLILFLIVPFIVLVGVIFFLYPYVSSDKFNDIAAANTEKLQAAMLAENPLLKAGTYEEELLPDTMMLTESDSVLELPENDSLAVTPEEEVKISPIDSLTLVLNKITAERDSLAELNARLSEYVSNNSEEFAERMKSLLNLEEEQLGPILGKLTNEQLVRLYQNGGTIQREKILKVLESDKAAALIREVM